MYSLSVGHPLTINELAYFQTLDLSNGLFVCFISTCSAVRFSRYGLWASYLATHNHSAIPEVTLKGSN
jgi:hypothetical protein